MSTLQNLGIHNIPLHALPYIAYGDSSGLTDEDAEQIDQWLAGEFPNHNCLTFHHADTEPPAMLAFPAFGLAAECVSIEVYGHPATTTE